MIVVSDATPINVLVRIGLVDLLPTLYTRVVIPMAVRDELSHVNTPLAVRAWLDSAPSWLEIRPAPVNGPGAERGRGEREAIALTVEIKADLLLVDDRAAAKTARSLGLHTVGTLGLLELASFRGLAPLPESVAKLRTTDFFLSDAVVDAALVRDRMRKALSE